ncbi:regulatory protein MsrR [Clostridium tepidiprofundi DSM 19306]|uniref:Regulatory protein MsrR n=1 Tax=Clostridium tepidiprofundi DSM 19306 TaxID=1121338 RepID=A0A151B4K9_9CLOT|nr:LCP family protein [Clostridium tepidiprofundi]KYH34845.1 regulatory protein MsrR [Clostridium tepidiprofundi DSM 19306]
MTKKKKGALVVSVIIIVVLISGFLYAFYSYEKYSHVIKKNNIKLKGDINTKSDEKGDENSKKEKDKYKEIDGISNILLVGIDARTLNEPSRSDAIMILTLDNVHKKIKLTSIMRDTYVEIPKHGEQKITHAFAYGGIDLLKDTIERNFKIKIDNFAIINFDGFKELIDSIGGLEINVKDSELRELNRCILLEIQDNPKLKLKDAHYLKKSGLQLLNGQQVLAYSRMRHIGNGCYDRSKRQRYVVNLIADKLRDTSLLKYPTVAQKLLKCVRTDLQFTEALNVAYTAYKIGDFNIEQLQIPADKLSYGRIYKDKGWVLLIDKEQNTDVLHKFIFDDIKYDPSKYRTFIYSKSKYYYKPPVEKKKIDEDKKQDNTDKNDAGKQKDVNNQDINNQNDTDKSKENNEKDTIDNSKHNNKQEDNIKNDDSTNSETKDEQDNQNKLNDNDKQTKQTEEDDQTEENKQTDQDKQTEQDNQNTEQNKNKNSQNDKSNDNAKNKDKQSDIVDLDDKSFYEDATSNDKVNTKASSDNNTDEKSSDKQ